jgi:hypothetical protein
MNPLEIMLVKFIAATIGIFLYASFGAHWGMKKNNKWIGGFAAAGLFVLLQIIILAISSVI